MSQNFPKNKDHIVNELDDKYCLGLDDAQYNELRRLTESQLFLITQLFAIAVKNSDNELREVHSMLAVAVRTFANNELDTPDNTSIDAYELCTRLCEVGDKINEGKS
jgi:hypothetical protein